MAEQITNPRIIECSYDETKKELILSIPVESGKHRFWKVSYYDMEHFDITIFDKVRAREWSAVYEIYASYIELNYEAGEDGDYE